MKLAIDLQSCLTDSRDRGIGRYSLSLATHLAMLAGNDDVLMLMDGADPERLRTLRKRLRNAGVDDPTAVYSYPVVQDFTDLHNPLVCAAALLKARFLNTVSADAILVTSLFETGTYCSEYDWSISSGPFRVVVAYDVIPLLFPERYLPSGSVLTARYYEKVEQLKSFDLFLAISEATRHDLIDHLSIPAEKIRVIGAGLDRSFLEQPREPIVRERQVLAGLGIDRPFILMVGNADWRKNSISALETFAALPRDLRERYQLVFTRVGEDVCNALNGACAHVADDVVILGSVEERVLSLLYSHCDVFFFPSLYEGFGLPVIEAMAMGAPVLTSSLGSLHEVVHDSRILFDPRDKTASVEILRRALTDVDFRQVMTAGAAQHAQSFTWEKCAAKVLSAIREKLGEKDAANRRVHDWAPDRLEIECLADTLPVAAGMDVQLQDSLQRIANSGYRRILVDMSEVIRIGAWTGIQRVVRNIFIGLHQLACDTRTFTLEPIYVNDQGVRFGRSFVREHLGLSIHGDDDVVSFESDDLLLMLDSSWISPQRFEPMYQDLRDRGGEIVWVVYDLVPILMPEVCHEQMCPIFSAWLDSVAAHSDGCVCISRSTEQDLISHFKTIVPDGQSRPWTRHFHLGSDLESGRVSTPSESTIKLTDRLRSQGYCLALSTVEPRKDHKTILAAFELLWSEGVSLPLVIVGKQGWNVEALAERLRTHESYGERLFWIEHAGDGDVAHLISNATCLVQASLAEGFGLAVAEAGSKGIPLFLSDLDVFREIAGKDAAYFPVRDHRALAGALSRAYRSGEWISPKDVVAMSWAESSRTLADILLGPVSREGGASASSPQR